MSRRELLKHLRERGCELHRRGGRHDIWKNTSNGQKSAVPRHRTIPQGTVRAICRQLGIPFPDSF